MIRLLIVDDHPVVRDGLRGMTASQPDLEVVGEAASGAEALALVPRVRPDVVLLDLRMPALDGVATIRALRERHPETRVLVLTTFDTDSDVVSAIQAGATGYLLKDVPRAELFRAVRAAARGETVLSPTVASRLAGRLRSPARPALTRRERQVLTLVAKGGSNRAVAASLHVSEATVKTHLLHAFGKLGVGDRTAAVTAALEQDLIRLDPPTSGPAGEG